MENEIIEKPSMGIKIFGWIFIAIGILLIGAVWCQLLFLPATIILPVFSLKKSNYYLYSPDPAVM